VNAMELRTRNLYQFHFLVDLGEEEDLSAN